MDREDIPKILFSSIKQEDPYGASKLLQIKRWCYANWDLHVGYGEKRNNFLAQIFSDEECWEKVNTLHAVKLNRQVVGKKLVMVGLNNPFGTDRYKIACRYCLEEDIRALFNERKEKLSAQGKSSLLEYEHLIECFGEGSLGQFWSHFVGDCISKLDLEGCHPYEYGLDCAIDRKQVQAVEFFWNKIKSLPENELSAQNKDEILMKSAVYSAGPNFRIYPDIFDFFLNQIDRAGYPKLLERDLDKNGHYGSLSKMKDMLNFDKFQELFDYLKPSDITEDDYHIWLKCIEIQNYQEYYVNAAEKLFLHIWRRDGFDSHRAFVVNEEVMDSSPFFHKNLLIRWVEKACMEPVSAVLDKLDSSQTKEYMTYKQADYIRSVLLGQGDNKLLDKFLSYNKFVAENLDQKHIPGPGADLADVELSKSHSKSHIG